MTRHLSPGAQAIVETFRSSLATIEYLSPPEQDYVYAGDPVRSAIATTRRHVARITWTAHRTDRGSEAPMTCADCGRVDPPVTVTETYRIGRRKVEVTICAPCRIANDRRDAR